MHDSFLMQNISCGIKKICDENNLTRVDIIEISFGHQSHITEKHLLEHLLDLNKDVLHENTQVKVSYEDMDELTAVIKKIQGEKV